MEASEGAGEHVHQEQPADEAGMDLQREQVSLPAALQQAKQPADGRGILHAWRSTEKYRKWKVGISGWFHSSRRSSVEPFLNEMEKKQIGRWQKLLMLVASFILTIPIFASPRNLLCHILS